MVSPTTAISRLIPSLLLGTVRTALDLPSELANFYTGADPDRCTGIEQLIRSKGYPFERHNAITSDGYIIEMHRIPHGKEPCKDPCHRQPILLMSGLLGDSSNFVLDFPKQSLGYVLADSKYDVWMGNVRGNTYGKRHKKYNKRSRRFWNFSFHEHAKYDLPAQIDYVLKNTGRKDLLYLGISQGTLLFFTMMSERPKYNDKRMAYTLGRYEIMPQGFPLMPLARSFCALPTRAICSLLGDEFGNLGSKYMNMSRVPVYLCHVPAGSSVKNIVHYSQLVQSKKATKFDYGPVDNKIYYGQEDPPEYKISNVKTDVGIFWSRGDRIVSPANVRELIKDLGPRVKKNHFIDDPYYTHVHFVMALNNPTLLYGDLLEFLDKYATSS
ncbi:gastric triacylglycerol lipase-like isoform X2 [Dermacentor variabilis]|uniref:gastric triacylglycerol lipase-like isoform X2 n=1 Tax=Dermacentor variabilis TaxID=34621 RepID=UPI003F5C70B3